MKLIDNLREWWQVHTGEEETPFDGDAPVWVISMLFHLVLMFVLAFTMIKYVPPDLQLTVTAPLEEEEEELEIPQEVYFNDQLTEKVEIGANSVQGEAMAESLAPVISEVSVVPSPVDMTPTDTGEIEIENTVQLATGLNFNKNLAVRGAVGKGETGAVGAVDRITHEILLSLEERKTLVVWLFDQSGSLERQRKAIHDRFNRIYEELGVLEAAENPAFAKHTDKPLLSSVIAFGDKVTLRTEKPTDDLDTIKNSVSEIEQDSTGNERVFSAVYLAANQFKNLRLPNEETGDPERNVMMVVFTDEVGDDQDGLEQTIRMCRRYEMPVYVVGIPAPFGRKETLVKWVDPDPEYDQTPQWGLVNQGPESFLPERIKLNFSGKREDDSPIDSGFGPFSLTRLCYETGGIYFAVHPNRNVNRAVSKRETAEFSAHIEHFFDPEIMRRYRPDYVSQDEYKRRIAQNKCRTALVKAAMMSWAAAMENPETEFVKRDEASFSNDLSEAQKTAARLAPRLIPMYETLKLGEADRDNETTPRWQAGYDLAMGRVLAVRARTEAYNAMLAAAKRGLKFEDPKNNTWILEPVDEISVGSQLEKMAVKAREYLQRVVDDHPGTPWALLARRELDNPIGWKWTEDFTDLSPRNNAGGGGGNAPARNDAKRMLKKPKPKRKIPRL